MKVRNIMIFLKIIAKMHNSSLGKKRVLFNTLVTGLTVDD